MPITEIRYYVGMPPVTYSEGASGIDRFKEHNYATGYTPPQVPALPLAVAFARDSQGYACLVRWHTDVGVGVLLASEAEQRGL
jgi:hypothetical protein